MNEPLSLLLVVFAVGVVRSFFTPEKTRQILAGKRESVGNVLASLLGVVTPFLWPYVVAGIAVFAGVVGTGILIVGFVFNLLL